MRATEALLDDRGTGLDPTPTRRSEPVSLVGARLEILHDRVDLRDGTNALRRSVNGSDITDVIVTIWKDSAVLTIETIAGPVISAGGLRPEQAESARSLIARRSRPTPESPSPSDQVEVLSTLGDLFVLGILTTSEYEAMLELTERLFGTEIVLPA